MVIELPKEKILEIGKIIATEIRKELISSLLKLLGSSPEGSKIEGLNKISKSFSVSVMGGKIKIKCSWPLIMEYTNGENVISKEEVPEEVVEEVVEDPIGEEEIEGSEDIVIVAKEKKEGWIHPAIKNYNFLQVGLRKGKEKAKAIIMEEVTSGGYITKYMNSSSKSTNRGS